MCDEAKPAAKRSYAIEPHASGQGWRVRLFTDGKEMGAGVFPPQWEELPGGVRVDLAYEEACEAGENWVGYEN